MGGQKITLSGVPGTVNRTPATPPAFLRSAFRSADTAAPLLMRRGESVQGRDREGVRAGPGMDRGLRFRAKRSAT